jgi:hypothetical protein
MKHTKCVPSHTNIVFLLNFLMTSASETRGTCKLARVLESHCLLILDWHLTHHLHDYLFNLLPTFDSIVQLSHHEPYTQQHPYQTTSGCSDVSILFEY